MKAFCFLNVQRAPGAEVDVFKSLGLTSTKPNLSTPNLQKLRGM